MKRYAIFLSVLCGCAYNDLPDAQKRAISDYRSAQDFCIKRTKKEIEVTKAYIVCMLDLGYIEPFPIPEE